jgi:DNA mismatch repair protein PMS2
LQSLSSFGFRGEALSSLCALAKVTITTRTKNEPIAVRLQYDHLGVIVSQENVARPVGTTVAVEKLFSPLPVRFKEFRRENNLRREYGKLLAVLQVIVLNFHFAVQVKSSRTQECIAFRYT